MCIRDSRASAGGGVGPLFLRGVWPARREGTPRVDGKHTAKPQRSGRDVQRAQGPGLHDAGDGGLAKLRVRGLVSVSYQMFMGALGLNIWRCARCMMANPAG